MKLIDIIVLAVIGFCVLMAMKAYRKKPSCCHDCNHACSSCNKQCKKEAVTSKRK